MSRRIHYSHVQPYQPSSTHVRRVVTHRDAPMPRYNRPRAPQDGGYVQTRSSWGQAPAVARYPSPSPSPSPPPPPPERDLLRIGSTVEGYTSLKRLGKGSFGVVLLCKDERNGGKLVAVKVLKADGNRETQEAHLAEQRTIRRLAQSKMSWHENISCPISNTGYYYKDILHTCIVTEYAAGGNLEDNMQSLGLANVKPIVRQLCSGLAHIHAQGCIHCDLKPENVLLMRRGELDLKITDLGLAQWLDPGEAERRVYPLGGTPVYFSPEHTGKVNILNRGIDMWPVGIILWNLMNGLDTFPLDVARHENLEEFRKIEDERYWYNANTYWHEHPEAKYLAERLLALNYKKRWTANEALRYSWLKRK